MTAQQVTTATAARELIDACQHAMRYTGVTGDVGAVLWNLIDIARSMES